MWQGSQKTMSLENVGAASKTQSNEREWIPLPWKSGIVPNCVTAKIARRELVEAGDFARGMTKANMTEALAESLKIIFYGPMPDNLELSVFTFEKDMGIEGIEFKMYAGIFAANWTQANISDLVMPIKLGLTTPRQINAPENETIQVPIVDKSPMVNPLNHFDRHFDRNKVLDWRVFQRRTIRLEDRRLVFYDRAR